MEQASTTSATRPALMTRRERREAEERAREAALRAGGRSGDTVVVGGITFHGPAPISPAVGNPVVGNPMHGNPALGNPALGNPAGSRQQSAVPAISTRPVVPRPEPAPSQARPAARPAPAPSPSRHDLRVPRQEGPAALAPPAPLPAPVVVSPPTPSPAPTPFPRVIAASEAGPAPAPALAPVAAAVPRELPSRAARAGREPRTEQAEAPRGRSWFPRVAVLGALAAATIAAPLAPGGPAAGNGGASPFDLDQASSGPSTLDVISARVTAPRVAQGIQAAPVLSRELTTASRSQDRDPLPGCDAGVTVSSSNGKLTDTELCGLPFAEGERLQARAAVALTALNEAYRDEFGVDLALVSSYRSLAQQYSVKASRGYLAARPGTSMHGLGLAIDLASSVTGSSAAYKWLVQNGAAYGWENPPWARRGGAGNYEPWHFEFRPGVEEISTWH
ncbi:peptidase M15B and M15C DD-carboxypeptidase VanY/endolysin [Xylanimonas cellulosilytica DSM 15894]|uniref:Peptidase M15B and M15C DD-carboxypeptidase VanY/endolysin n=1 Tax=Xylanimonas cellulosilytica (strain DSM 15894 / JCM 12276 / CECT 5975 / KCTC 9989 / LMG 20990 / NBRC 107835 / XIL07) TaxID=446471 RepID=D1BWF2_XYLCX|nr:M15 family metallopeptidase [Xylanimonas cellulosilytica]ACZ31497.1 peptidase M15B and M15C DD-carboxypeptidase VanY/endolysin [Xylanimonas cellulosilytica DSM 15894]